MNITIQELKHQMAGRGEEFVRQYLNDYQMNGRNQPCPHCGGRDRYRYIKNSDGGFYCSHSDIKMGDWIDHVAHTQGMTKGAVIQEAKVFLGLDNPTPQQKREADERRKRYEAKQRRINTDNAMRLQMRGVMNELFCESAKGEEITEKERDIARDLVRLLVDTYKQPEQMK